MVVEKLSDIFLDVRNHTRVKYENVVKDGETAFLTDMTYRRAFGSEFLRRIDGIVRQPSYMVIIDSPNAEFENDGDYRIALRISKKAKKCFPSMFVQGDDLDGLCEDDRRVFLLMTKSSNNDNKSDVWTKYFKSKVKT